MPLAILAPVQWLIDVFLPVLEFFHDKLGFGWGMSIIVLTILLRFAVLPLSVKSFKSMLGLQAIAPQMKELQKKYKDDKPRLQQETMKLYSENKVNPLGSCLPILVQIPFLISFYYMLRTDLKDEICGVRSSTTSCSDVPNPLNGWMPGQPIPSGSQTGGFGEHFLGIHDITAFATGGLLVLLLVLYVGSQMLSSVVNMPPTADKNQKRLMLGLPLFLVVFLIPIKPPSGVFLYWITTNLFTLVQQFSLRKIYGGPSVIEMAKSDDAGDGGLFGTKKEPATATAKPATAGGAAPPPPPRKRKKKRSGRRR